MKKTLLLFLIFITANALNATTAIKNNTDQPKSPLIINAGDTVVFDLSNATIVGNYIQFPVSILSDDVVNALDFALKFNYPSFTYDSTFNLTSYISPFGYFNPTDSTLRLTSNSLQTYANNTPLLSIRFNIGSGFTCSDINLNTITVYLNGDPCSFKVINCTPISTGISAASAASELLTVYPNPATDFFQVDYNSNSAKEIIMVVFDSNGRKIIDEKHSIVEGTNTIKKDVHKFKSGMYFVQLIDSKYNTVQTVKLIK